jgi:FKBP-type peptidyl-prolyl cis-trans isomerase FkpA
LSVKTNSQRIIILVIVVVFFLTSVAATAVVIYDAVKQKDSPTAAKTEEAKDQQPQKKEGGLEGTKLANFTPVNKVDSLQSIDTVPGNGAAVAAGGTVTAHYTGALAKDGTIFQSSKDSGQPFTAPLTGVIPGWQQGIPGMKVGGTRRLVIPASLAYGAQAQGNIPANSDLVFDIELIDTK